MKRASWLIASWSAARASSTMHDPGWAGHPAAGASAQLPGLPPLLLLAPPASSPHPFRALHICKRQAVLRGRQLSAPTVVSRYRPAMSAAIKCVPRAFFPGSKRGGQRSHVTSPRRGADHHHRPGKRGGERWSSGSRSSGPESVRGSKYAASASLRADSPAHW